jgi:heme/copper-type cytochrome/quinol oxidase subunit 1
MTNQPAKKAAPKKTSPKKVVVEDAPQSVAMEPRVNIDVAAIGRWSFILGVVLAVVAALVPTGTIEIRWFIYPMLVLGLVSGAIKFSKDEEVHFILVAISLVVFQSVFQNLFSTVPQIGTYLNAIFTTLMFFLASALVALIVKTVVRWFGAR